MLENTHSDLNVYTQTLPDGSRRSEPEILGRVDEGNSCTPIKKSQDIDSIKSSKGCCIPSNMLVEEIGVTKSAKEFRDLDLNEWVGQFQP